MESKHQPILAQHYNVRGDLYFGKTRYKEAYEDYKKAAELTLPDDPSLAVYQLNLGNTCQCLHLYDEAKTLYKKILANTNAFKDTKSVAWDELKNIENNHFFVSRNVKIKADDERLYKIVHAMLVDYPFITATINLWWVNYDQISLSRISKMEERFNVEPERRITGINWSALSHYPQSVEHFIFLVKDQWDGANDEELKGVLAHELTHEEWKEAGMSNIIPDPSYSAVTYMCNERITDLITISKGYGQALLLSRRFQERMGGSMEYIAVMSPGEIEHIINSELFLQQNAQWQTAFAFELASIIGGSKVVTEEWEKGAELWEKVIASNPNRSQVYYELGIAYHWLNDFKQAESCYRKALLLEPQNLIYKEKLNELLPARETTE